ncbi:MAG TPA: LamG-like jellyroll fold domain-containing protein, partial [Sedimentisphaerales bacterium]|nr:LamG-like jellyroll fold domain-containing protein [Sedimentisphaerales bacterium]
MCRGLSRQMGAFVVFFVMVVLSSTLNAQDPSLVLYFSFDDDVAGEATDHSVYGNNGALRGNPAPAEGKFGSALMFDAVDDQVVVPTSATLDIEDEITLMAWINPGANLTADWRTIVAKSPSSTLGSALFSYDIRTDQNGVLRFSLYIGGWQYILGPTPVEGTWYHIAGTYDGSQMVFYVDGTPVGTTQTSGKINVTTDPVCVGNIVNAAGVVSNEYWSGMIDEVRIWNRALSEEEVKTNTAQGKGELLAAQLALSPEPADGQTDVLRDVSLSWAPGVYADQHDVYFGAIFDDVNSAGRTNPRGVLASQGQLATTYDPPGRLNLGQTYYWRVDEVNAPPDSTIFKGNVWSFTVEPIAYPIAAASITATASSSNSAAEGPESTVNGSGLNASDLHSAANTDMWLSSMTGAQPTWIQYEFDRVHKLHQMVVWNYNTTIEPAIGFGVKEAAIEYSTDGANWTPLGSTHEFARGPGSAGYAANTTIDLGGVAAKYVKITANSNWGGFVKQYGLSEVRFFSVPVVAREPSPNPGATGVDVDVILSFRPGREAAKHNVYL